MTWYTINYVIVKCNMRQKIREIITYKVMIIESPYPDFCMIEKGKTNWSMK